MDSAVAAMSGGVDSSVAAAIINKNYKTIGVTIRTWNSSNNGSQSIKEAGDSSLDAIIDAKTIADKLGISHYTVDFSDEFHKNVIENFLIEYFEGRTPNPCVICNKKIKWKALLNMADQFGAKYVATGHYAILEFKNNRYCIKSEFENKKDQTYALWSLSQEQLSRTLFPLGGIKKEDVRNIAKKMSLNTANKPDSQEICFIPDNNYGDFIKKNMNGQNMIIPGSILFNGSEVGKHSGIPFYTIGQRRGLKIAMGEPVYVTQIDKYNNTIHIGRKEELYKCNLLAEDVNYISYSQITEGRKVISKIRYSDKGSIAEVIKADEKKIRLKFIEPKCAITPGQSVVLYDEDGYLIAGGIIKGAY